MTQRSQPLAGAPLWSGFLTKNQVYSSKAATASIPRALAGQARMMWEHANGQVISDPTSLEPIAPCAPRNSRAMLGEDHSGPPFAREFKHTYFVWANVDMGDTTANYEFPPTVHSNGGLTSPLYGFDNDILVPVPAGVQGGRYEQATVRAAIYCATAAASSTARLRLYSDGAGGASEAQSQDFDTTTTGYKEITFTNTLDMIPGRLNRVRVTLVSPATTKAILCYLQAICFSQEG